MKKDISKYSAYESAIVRVFAFARRPGMYVGQQEMDLIIAFIEGMRFATSNKIDFGNDLIEYIFEKYPSNQAIQKLADNRNFHTLKQQVEVLSTSTELTPEHIFRKEAEGFLVYISDEIYDGLFRRKLKVELIEHLNKNLEASDSEFTSTFLSSPEDSIYKYFNEWSGKTMPTEQLKILKDIKDINYDRMINWHQKKEGEIDDKSELRKLSKELLDKITEDNTW